jgi:hypothetical protein
MCNKKQGGRKEEGKVNKFLVYTIIALCYVNQKKASGATCVNDFF